mmetsp:Transcript_31569/g.32142  ORF Transcript_31569/g.32142 Transcript_31569/m.32142 type:complete len:399 (+) Transcript_31569:117-1313(+)
MRILRNAILISSQNFSRLSCCRPFTSTKLLMAEFTKSVEIGNGINDAKKMSNSEVVEMSQDTAEKPKAANVDSTSKDYYFDSYAHFGIHEEMLKDEVRTKCYLNAIEKNKRLFEGKIVLDVGCGTGILSMFAARAGAQRVFAVECSSIVEQARVIIRDNGFEDKIEVLQGKMEEIELPVESVDIIISEWMGYFLLYESMLETVLYARDKYLKPGGVILPDKAVLYLAAIEDSDYKKEKIDYWDNVYGFNMKVIKDIAIAEPLVDCVDSKCVLSDSVPILRLDLLTCRKEDLSFTANFTLRMQRNDYCDGFVAYFETAFTQIHKPLILSTSPHSKYTHWKQTVFYLSDSLTVSQGEIIEGRILCAPNNKNPRDLDITIQHRFSGKNCEPISRSQEYRIR